MSKLLVSDPPYSNHHDAASELQSSVPPAPRRNPCGNMTSQPARVPSHGPSRATARSKCSSSTSRTTAELRET
eukprot:617494-Rhodomonas_salina.2